MKPNLTTGKPEIIGT